MLKRLLRGRLRGPRRALEYLVKRTLSGLLWGAWRSRLHPFSFSEERAYTAGRYYIERWVRERAPECRGRFLEFGIPYYRDFFSQQAIESYDTFEIEPGPGVTLVGDIQSCPQIADNSYDVIICTQVLEHVPNPFLAAAELRRILKPGGLLLLTVPAAFPYHADPHDYWRFSKDSLRLLFGQGFHQLTITPYGNRLTVTASYWFWLQKHLPRRALAVDDPACPTLLAMEARK